MSIPLRITGPAVVQFNGQTYYFQEGLKGSLKRNVDYIKVDTAGAIAAFMKNFVVEFSGRPAGVLSQAYFESLFPYTRNDHGKSIFGATDLPLVIWALHPFDTSDLNKVTFQRGAIKKSPTLLFSATKGQAISSDMTFSALMASDFDLTAADAWYSAVHATFAGTPLNLDLIRTARYTAALGSRSAPYDSMLAQDGFTFESNWGTKDIDVDNFGIIDQVVDAGNFAATAKFKPANLRAAEVDELISLQDTTALLPGDVIGGTNENLVITSDLFVATLKNCDASDTARQWESGMLQAGEVMFINAAKFTSGVDQAYFTFSVP
jgi:hypothetical protein